MTATRSAVQLLWRPSSPLVGIIHGDRRRIGETGDTGGWRRAPWSGPKGKGQFPTVRSALGP